MEVKKKFRKDRIEKGDAWGKYSWAKIFQVTRLIFLVTNRVGRTEITVLRRASCSAGETPAILHVIDGAQTAGETTAPPNQSKNFISGHCIEVIAVAGKHGEARTLHAHLDRVIGLRVIGLRGGVGERVLIARLLGDARIEPFKVLAARAIENISARGVRVFRKDVVSKKSDAAVEIRLPDADRIHGNVSGEQQLERFIVAVRVVLGVLPVGDQENNFAPLA